MTSFDPAEGLVLVEVRLWGPAENMLVEMAIDTGATSSLVDPHILHFLGYDTAAATSRVGVTTGSGMVFAPLVTVSRVAAFNIERENLPLISHALPPSASVDGLLGLDFFRGRRLLIDFVAGEIEVT